MIDPVTYLYDYRDDLGGGFQIFSPKGDEEVESRSTRRADFQ